MQPVILCYHSYQEWDTSHHRSPLVVFGTFVYVSLLFIFGTFHVSSLGCALRGLLSTLGNLTHRFLLVELFHCKFECVPINRSRAVVLFPSHNTRLSVIHSSEDQSLSHHLRLLTYSDHTSFPCSTKTFSPVPILVNLIVPLTEWTSFFNYSWTTQRSTTKIRLTF